jgi:hypothetical protein
MKMLSSLPLFLAIVTVSSMITPASQAASNVSWAGTNLWQAPVVTDLDASIIFGDNDTDTALLKAVCDDFESLNARSAGLPVSYRKQMFEDERKKAPDSQFPRTSFSVELRTSLPGSGSLLDRSTQQFLANAFQARNLSAERALFFQSTDALLSDLGDGSLVSTESQAGSLTEAASSLGLQVIAPELLTKPTGTTLLLRSKDLACDLLRGRATIVWSAPAYARISQASQVTLKSFYARVNQIAAEVLARFKRPFQRAAMLGFRLSGAYANIPGVSEGQAESSMLATLDALFDPTTVELNANSLQVRGLSDQFKLSITIHSAKN